MNDRLTVMKTYKLFIGGAFPRSESGKTVPVIDDTSGTTVAHAAWASRKDLRDAVAAARKAQPAWADRSAYNRGQILYRIAEMIEGKRDELAAALNATLNGNQPIDHDLRLREIDTTADLFVRYAGWADKLEQVLGGLNAVAGPYENFAAIEGVGVAAVIAPTDPTEPALLSAAALLAPIICSGSTAVLITGARPLAHAVLAEALATSDVPPGVINILTADAETLVPWVAEHRDIDAVHAAGLPEPLARTLRSNAADNLKRVTVRENTTAEAWFNPETSTGAWWIEPFVETKSVWHARGV